MTIRTTRRRGISLSGLNVGTYGALVLYLAILVVSFTAVMRPGHTYFALRTNADPSPIVVALGVLLFPLPALRMPRQIRSLTSFTVTILLIAVVMPATILGMFADVTAVGYYICIVLVSIALIEWARIAQARATRVPYHPLPESRDFEMILLIAALAVCGYILFAYRGPLQLVGPIDVYGLRLAAREYATSTFTYATAIYGGAIGPVALVYGWVRRRWLLFGVAVAGFVLIYMAQGDKRAILLVPLCIVALIVFRKTRPTYGLVNLATLAIAVCAALDGIIGRPLFTALVVERTLAAPGLLTAFYHQYFSQHDFIVWSNSFLSRLGLGSGADPAFIIGTNFFHDQSRANASFLAEGYAQLGYAGIAILLGVMLVSLALLERALLGLRPALTISMSLALVISWANLSPLTALVTGGGFVLIVLAFFLNRRRPAETFVLRRTIRRPISVPAAPPMSGQSMRTAPSMRPAPAAATPAPPTPPAAPVTARLEAHPSPDPTTEDG